MYRKCRLVLISTVISVPSLTPDVGAKVLFITYSFFLTQKNARLSERFTSTRQAQREARRVRFSEFQRFKKNTGLLTV